MSIVVDRVKGLTRAAARRGARDMTAAAKGRSALVIAPHPDDETIGCGATILRKVVAGQRVTLLVVTDGSRSHDAMPPDRLAELRREEMVEAAARLGVSDLRWAGFEDGTATDREDELVELLVSIIGEVGPDEVYATCAEEFHPDHAAVGRAARRAVARAAQPATLLEYPIWLWDSPLADFARVVLTRRAVTVRTEPYRTGKLDALRAHHSQLRRPDDVPAEAEWPVLPAELLAAAADEVEIFFEVSVGPGR